MLPFTISHSRTRFLAGMIILLIAVFIVRLFYIQVIRHEHYALLANSEQMRQWTLPSVRGEIYAMDGDRPVKLVLNEAIYTVWADPQAVAETDSVNPDRIMAVLQRIAGGNLLHSARQSLTKVDTRYQVLAKKVTHTQAQLIKEEGLYGIGFERSERRVYPEGQLASHVLGFVNDDGQGQYGIEGGLNDELTGRDGLIKTVADVRDVPLTIGEDNVNIPAVNGRNIVLTIDRGTQAIAEQALTDGLKRSGAQKGSVLVMDPSNGHVLAMANLPTYDPSEISSVRDVAVFNNGTISTPYEPGSVIKTFTVATGLEQGVITPQSTFVNTDSIRVGDITIGNAARGYTGPRSMQFALDLSLNTGMVTIAQKLGGGTISKSSREVLYDYFNNKFRLGKKTGIALANESTGTIISPNEVQGNAVRYATMSFGQGMSATMLQVSAGFCSLVNGGIYYQPTVIAGLITPDGEYIIAEDKPPSRTVTEATSSTVREMIHHAHYATYRPQKERSGYYIGGKTGTTQTIDSRTGKYTSDETIATYLGFGGEVGETPQYVIMVRVSGKGLNLGGGSDAKPIFNDISSGLIDHLKLQPKQ